MQKMSAFLLLFLIFLRGLSAQHHGVAINLGGGMVNTTNDQGMNPDNGVFSASAAYLLASQKDGKKFYSLTRFGLGYESSGSFQGVSVFVDTGTILWDIWRIGVGMQVEMVTSPESLLKNGVIMMPYIETGLMWKVFAQSGFDFGFKLGSPIKLTSVLVEPFYHRNKMDTLSWQFSAGYFHFF